MKFSTVAALAGFASVVQGLAIPEPLQYLSSRALAFINPPALEKRQSTIAKRNTYVKIVYTDPSFISQMVNIHNQYRAHHGVGQLTWNPTLAQKAFNTSTGCVFMHSTVRPYGENVAAGSYQFNNPAFWVYLWWNEIKSYDYNNPGYAAATGHFTQVVWKASTQIGCAWVQGCTGSTQPVYAQMVWCEYYPPGNVLPNANFATNVLQELASPAAPAVPAMSTT